MVPGSYIRRAPSNSYANSSGQNFATKLSFSALISQWGHSEYPSPPPLFPPLPPFLSHLPFFPPFRLLILSHLPFFPRVSVCSSFLPSFPSPLPFLPNSVFLVPFLLSPISNSLHLLFLPPILCFFVLKYLFLDSEVTSSRLVCPFFLRTTQHIKKQIGLAFEPSQNPCKYFLEPRRNCILIPYSNILPG